MLYLEMQAPHKMVKTGDVKTRTIKSDRGSILTVTKLMICMNVSSKLANAKATQIFQVNFNGSLPILIPRSMKMVPKIMTCNTDRVAIISPGDTGSCLAM